MNSQLYEKIQSAYELVKKADDKPIDSLALHTSNDYSDNKTIEIKARFGNKTQNLEGIAVTLYDKNPYEAFTREEIENLVEFIQNPSRLSINGNLKGEIYYSVIGESFGLTIEKYRLFGIKDLFKTIEWKTQGPILDVSDIIIPHGSYEELTNIFGLSLPEQAEFLKITPPTKINISKIPDAYIWLLTRHFEPDIQGSNDKRYLGIRIHLDHFYGVAINNEFTLDSAFERTKVVQQVNAIENKIKMYRGTDLTQMPFTVFKYHITPGETTSQGLKTEYRQRVEVGRI